MKKILLILFISTVLPVTASARCWIPNCYSAVGFNPKTGQGYTQVDHSTNTSAKKAILNICPDCIAEEVQNGCIALFYSPSKQVARSFIASNAQDAYWGAMDRCRYTASRKVVTNNHGDSRKSKRVRTPEKSDCVAVAQVCSSMMY